MNKLLVLFAMLVLPFGLHAQEDAGAAAERARIAAERNKAEAEFRAQQNACYGKFAVNDCLSAVKAQRRQVLADLRRQEISLNDAQRKRKAAEHLRELEQRTAPDKQPEQAQRRAQNSDGHGDRESAVGRKAAERAADVASRPARAAAREEQAARKQAEASAARAQRAEQAARNVKKQQERLAKAEERKASRDKRLAERKKPPAQPLPPPAD
jgi:hypothetical protein